MITSTRIVSPKRTLLHCLKLRGKHRKIALQDLFLQPSWKTKAEGKGVGSGFFDILI